MKEKILIITSNKSKIKEISTILGEYGVETLAESIDIPEFRKDTLEDVSKQKAITAFSLLQKPLLVDDTGIFFEAFDEFPGVVTRFIFEKIGYEGILRLLEGKSRNAFYKSCITYIEKSNEPVIFTGEFHGTISEKPSLQEDPHFPYDSIFIPEGCSVPRIEQPLEKRIEGSHRRKALINFRDWYLSNSNR
ncbi:MAG: non-canonical purine NTP pyrophosphatase [bacterium]|nr:non-canonical purine NTP pyrophosphatase [bacterium]